MLGVEAALWSETLTSLADVEFMAFPRLLAVAEVACADAARDWDDFRSRVALEGMQLETLGVNFFRSHEVPW